MKNLKQKTKCILLIFVSILSTIALAQNPLHQKQHEEYIASINRSKIQNDYANKIVNDILKQNENSKDVTITDVSAMHNWESPRVNCYTDITAPEHAKLDVSEFVMPVNGRLTSNYGYRPKFRRMHRGVDLSLKTGDTVRSAMSGRVRIVANEPNGYGKYVVVRHDNGVETVYGHFSKHIVKKGDYVAAGQAIGLGGSTGRSTGPHLHFEFRYLGLALNPSLIFNFSKGVTYNDIYTFNKTEYQGYSYNNVKTNIKKNYKKKSYATKSSKRKKKG